MSNSDHSSFPGPVSILPAESELASTTSSSSSSEEEYFLLNDLVNNDLNIFVEKTNQGTTSASPPSSTSSSLHTFLKRIRVRRKKTSYLISRKVTYPSI